VAAGAGGGLRVGFESENGYVGRTAERGRGIVGPEGDVGGGRFVDDAGVAPVWSEGDGPICLRFWPTCKPVGAGREFREDLFHRG
jgi:hypothetical protein